MSDVLGYQRGVSYNNDIINRNRALQREVHNENLNNLNNYNILEKQSQNLIDSDNNKYVVRVLNHGLNELNGTLNKVK